jgi:hypothetical protein
MRLHHCSVLFLALPLVFGCLETDLTLQSDGAVKGTITWTMQPGAGAEAARNALKADGVTVTKVEVKEAAASAGAPKLPRATATVEAKTAAALTQTPLLKLLGATATLGEPTDGTRTLTVKVANTNKAKPYTTLSDNVIRLHFPGDVSKTSAKADGKSVTWTIPDRDYFDTPGAELSVVYANGGS